VRIATPRTSTTPCAARRMRVMSKVGRQATRPSRISNAPEAQLTKAKPMPAPVVGSPPLASSPSDPLMPPPPPPPPITVAAGITVTPSRSTGSPKTWRALSASRADLNAYCGSIGSLVRAPGPRSCVSTAHPFAPVSPLLLPRESRSDSCVSLKSDRWPDSFLATTHGSWSDYASGSSFNDFCFRVKRTRTLDAERSTG
jgi:hypothetical protein